MILTLHQYIRDIARRHLPIMFDATIGLHMLDRIHPTKELAETEFMGSGIVVRYQNAVYMLTASHVVDACGGEENVYFHYTDNNGIPSVGSPGGVVMKALSEHDCDVTRFELDITLFADRTIVPIVIDNEHHLRPMNGGSIFVVAGIPSSAVRKKSGRGPFQMRVTPIIARESDHYPAKYPRQLKLVLDYDRKRQTRVNSVSGAGQLGVDPKGMSGCGIFEISLVPHQLSGHTMRLVAIFTDYDKQSKILIGTRIHPLLISGMFE